MHGPLVLPSHNSALSSPERVDNHVPIAGAHQPIAYFTTAHAAVRSKPRNCSAVCGSAADFRDCKPLGHYLTHMDPWHRDERILAEVVYCLVFVTSGNFPQELVLCLCLSTLSWSLISVPMIVPVCQRAIFSHNLFPHAHKGHPCQLWVRYFQL